MEKIRKKVLSKGFLMNLQVRKTLTIFMIFITTYFVKGFPHKRSYSQNNIELNDEKRYPNGTVIGKYTCRDKDGNPVYIKYYADDSSYGVELNSFKVLTLNNDYMSNNIPKLNNSLKNVSFQFDEINNTINALSKELHKSKTKDGVSKNNKNKSEMQSKTEGYDVLFEKEVKPLDKFNSDKVRIYYDGHKRKSRTPLQHYAPFIEWN